MGNQCESITPCLTTGERKEEEVYLQGWEYKCGQKRMQNGFRRAEQVGFSEELASALMISNEVFVFAFGSFRAFLQKPYFEAQPGKQMESYS